MQWPGGRLGIWLEGRMLCGSLPRHLRGPLSVHAGSDPGRDAHPVRGSEPLVIHEVAG